MSNRPTSRREDASHGLRMPNAKRRTQGGGGNTARARRVMQSHHNPCDEQANNVSQPKIGVITMLINTSTMIPWKSNDYNENLLVDFLNQGCCWKGPYSYGDKEVFFVAYAEFCRLRGTTSESRGMTETRLQRLGHEVNRDGIRGIFVRVGSEVP